MAHIQIMNELLANKIAAGEVVERCASVVKELVENSIDANSTEIKIELKEAGTKQIRVIDNGFGMSKEDALLSFHRHATSKIKNEYDLFNINTLGFRGEALASIASVSQVILKTANQDVGTYIKIEGGTVKEVKATDARKGTIIEVNNLFYNTPARLKHMKSLYTELASITDYVNKIALSFPTIKFVLTNNGNTLLNTDGSGNLQKVIKNIYGVSVARKMVEIKGENNDYSISGYISFPEIHRSNRNAMITLVNGRVVRNTELNKVINDSYHSYKPDNRYPVVVLNIETDPSLIDVNIHPTKMDIKFSNMEELLQLVQTIIQNQLHQMNHTPVIEATKTVVKDKVEQIALSLEREEEKEEDDMILVDDDQIQTPLFEIQEQSSEETVEKKPKFKELYPVGVVHGTYIVCQNEDGMTLIDQHAAKERVNYEKYKYQLGHPNHHSIPLLIPITLEFSNSEFIILKQNFDLLKNMGFEIEEFGIQSIIIKAHPTWLPKNYEKQAIQKICEAVISFEKDFTIEKFNESIATMLSCKLAIKANQSISMEEIHHLIDDLKKCDNPFHCPHGRPTMIFYSKYDLEKLFKRSGF